VQKMRPLLSIFLTWLEGRDPSPKMNADAKVSAVFACPHPADGKPVYTLTYKLDRSQYELRALASTLTIMAHPEGIHFVTRLGQGSPNRGQSISKMFSMIAEASGDCVLVSADGHHAFRPILDRFEELALPRLQEFSRAHDAAESRGNAFETFEHVDESSPTREEPTLGEGT
jgi:hypothetical protein